jgi:uncharacterized membrane protein
MKTVGLVTRYFVDEDTGEELASVYVPTAPNPAGGYLEIVPVIELVPLDWTVDQAMSFVFSGGTTAPERIRFSRKQRDDAAEDASSSVQRTSEQIAQDDYPAPRDQRTPPRTAKASSNLS